MKKTYVKPVMQSEEFVTNAYCGTCTDNPILNGELYVNNTLWTWPVAGNRGNTTVTVGNTTYYTDHTFIEANSDDYTSSYGGGKFWKCTCHDGRYLLEYSAHHSGDSRYGGGNGKSVFYLYYDRTDIGNFNVANFDSDANGPWGGTGNQDLVLSRVTYEQGTTPVLNS